MSRNSLSQIAAVAVIAASLAAGCSSEKSVQGAVSTAPATTTSVAPDTVAPPEASTSVATPSTVPAETSTTTTAPSAPAGWSAIDPATIEAPLAFPCCGSNWYRITPSPALPEPGAPLADGQYRIDFQFPTDFSQPVTATVSRFELCSNLPTDACQDTGGFTADDIGVADAGSTTIQLTIDGSLAVVLGGFNGSGSTDDFVIGNGADLAELVSAVDADYQTAVLDPAAGGTDFASIVANLVASPASGFSAPVDEGSGLLTYTHDGAPPLLFQVLPGDRDGAANARGSDVIGRIALVVSGGVYKITAYAGYYS